VDDSRSFALEGKGKDKKEGNGEEGSLRGTIPPSSSNPILIFKCLGGEVWNLFRDEVDKRQKTWPEMDVMAEIRGLWQWCEDNSEKRKTPKGMPAFLTRNLNRAYHEGRFIRKGEGVKESKTTRSKQCRSPDVDKEQDAEHEASLKRVSERNDEFLRRLRAGEDIKKITADLTGPSAIGSILPKVLEQAKGGKHGDVQKGSEVGADLGGDPGSVGGSGEGSAEEGGPGG